MLVFSYYIRRKDGDFFIYRQADEKDLCLMKRNTLAEAVRETMILTHKSKGQYIGLIKGDN